MPTPSDAWADQVEAAAAAWIAAAEPDDHTWWERWYAQNGPVALLQEMADRRAETLRLLALPAHQWRAELAGLPLNERRLLHLCCLRHALTAIGLMRSFAAAGVDVAASAEHRLALAGQVAEGLIEDYSDPWPFEDDPWDRD